MSFADIGNRNGVAGTSNSKQNAPPDIHEMATLKLSQFQRQVQWITGVVKNQSFDKDKDLKDRAKYAGILQEEVAKSIARIPEQQSLQKRMLCKDFDRISKELEASVKKVSIHEQMQRELLENSIDSAEDEHGQEIEFQVLENEMANNEALIQEREKDITRIHQSVVQVNEIFQDLATIVQNQQCTIDDIETNIQESHARTEAGLEQVQKAANAQSSCTIQ